jgi:hypothetical protein
VSDRLERLFGSKDPTLEDDFNDAKRWFAEELSADGPDLIRLLEDINAERFDQLSQHDRCVASHLASLGFRLLAAERIRFAEVTFKGDAKQ